MLRFKSNCRVILVVPSAFVEVICDRPEICANCVSSGVATEEAMVSGLAPGNDADTEIVGKSTCGSGATGSSGNTTRPTRKIPPINSEVAIGLRTNGSEMLMILSACGVVAHVHAGLQPVLIAGHDPLIQGDALLDDRQAAALVAELQRTHFHRRVALDHVGERSVRAKLYGGTRHGERVLFLPDEHARIDILNGPKALALIAECGFESCGAGGLIDFIVDQRQRAFVQHGIALP